MKVSIYRDVPGSDSRVVAELELREDDPRGLSDAFAVTGELYERHGTWSGKAQHENGREPDACGAIHGEILKAFPGLAPLVALHLSDPDGVPMHAAANAAYFIREGKRDAAARTLRVAEADLPAEAEDVPAFVEAQRARWSEEAQTGRELLAVVACLARENPDDPSGQWSAFDVAESTSLDVERVRTLFAILLPDGGRYVGGTSGHLYHLFGVR